MNNREIKVKATVEKCVYDSDTFRVYAMNVTEVINGDVIENKYGNISLSGAIQKLDIGIDYIVEAVFEDNKYGGGYKAKSVSIDKPTSLEETYSFLCAIMPEKYAKEIFEHYPNIIEMVENGEEPDLNKLNGIKDKMWVKIKRKIEENFKLADIVALFDGAISMTMIKKIYNKYENAEIVKQLLSEKPYECICNVGGFGFIKADTLILNLAKSGKFKKDMISSSDRCLAAMVYILRKNEDDGNTLMLFKDFNSEVKSLVPEAYHNIKEIFDNEKNNPNKKRFCVFQINDDVCISLKRTRDKEIHIAKTIKKALSLNNKWNIDYNRYTSIDGFQPSDEQRRILETVCNNNISILNGAGGTGKTTSTRLLVKMLEENHKSFILLAPTGKASKVLQSYTSHGSSTIHRALGYNNGGFYYCEDNKLNVDIVIVDETSMIDISLFKSLLDAIDFRHTKLLLIGDASQLPSVGCGNVFYDLLSSSLPKVNLTKVFRYADGGLMKVATDVRNRKKYIDETDNKITHFGDDYTFIQSNKGSIKIDVIKIYKKLLEMYKPDDIMVLSPYRKGDLGCDEINKWLQKLANRNANNENNKNITYGDASYYVGDMVIQNQNNYNAIPCTMKEYRKVNGNKDRLNDSNNTILIANGETGIIKMIDKNNVIIDFNGQQVLYNKSELSGMSLGYALTIHKSQGDSSKIVILITSSSHTFMLNSNIIYVGMTRTKEKCYHLGDIKIVNRAIRIKENYDRKTSLNYLLKQAII